MKPVFTQDPHKIPFYFLDEDRGMFEGIKADSIIELPVRDEAGAVVTITFSVTRNAFLGSYIRRIHGAVLGAEDGLYREIQIHLHKNDPKSDRIGVFLQAPPLE